jgi:cyclohexadieny/prephenate dehydrogenase
VRLHKVPKRICRNIFSQSAQFKSSFWVQPENCHMHIRFDSIAVLGAGLLGGSLLQAVKARKVARRTLVWSRSKSSRDFCAGKPWCDAVFETPEACVRDAELVIICVPPDKIGGVLADIAPALGPTTLVTDVGSTKEGVCAAALAMLAPWGAAERFVGSHPMAGSEKSGAENASPDLFAGQLCYVSQHPEPTEVTLNVFDAVKSFWEALGMRVIPVSADAHDAILALTSHLPHLVAATLSTTIARDHDGTFLRSLAGQGLWDTTRISAGDPALWRAIFSENRSQVMDALRRFQETLREVAQALDTADFVALEGILKTASDWRSEM